MNSLESAFRLFIIDDSDIMRRHLVSFVGDKNFSTSVIQIVEGNSYEEAMLRFAHHLMSPFLGGVLTDYHLGGINGLQLVIDLRNLARTAYKDPSFYLPAVVMTQGGRLIKEDQVKADNLNIHVLSKPNPQNMNVFLKDLKTNLNIP